MRSASSPGPGGAPLERAGQTARLLDVKYQSMGPTPPSQEQKQGSEP
jgi:uncharacterized alpha-E superfamily protein